MKRERMSKITFEKYVAVAELMRQNQEFVLDISKYDVEEVTVITILCKNDAVFDFFNSVKDMDIRKLKAIMELLDAEEKLNKVNAILNSENGLDNTVHENTDFCEVSVTKE